MSLKIKATLKTPKVLVDFENGRILLAGISIPEDPYAFYSPVNFKIKEYLNSPKKTTTLEFKLEYFNTSSTLVIRNLIHDLSESNIESDLKIKWFYEKNDQSMKEAGEEFKFLFDKLSFKLIEIEEF